SPLSDESRRGGPMTRHMAAAALCLLSTLAAAASAQAPLAPVAAHVDSAAAYHFDLARYFFASPASEVAGRVRLRERFSALRAAGGRLTNSPTTLLAALRLADNV